MVEDQKFRADLFYRLNVFPVHVPPLRERPEDIPLLVRHFVQQFARRMGKAVDTIPTETMNVLIRYHWPGNIRELQNLMERAVILSTGPVLKVPLNDLQTTARCRPPAEEDGDAGGGGAAPHPGRARCRRLGDQRARRAPPRRWG